ncbi:hypothetical protein QSH57_003347 [Fusarium oxysporum f. sp. vasinfectum]|nr:hypothetical protein QSH57_003347 [Fusarium oxysporum f. sp. vasinfectum]
MAGLIGHGPPRTEWRFGPTAAITPFTPGPRFVCSLNAPRRSSCSNEPRVAAESALVSPMQEPQGLPPPFAMHMPCTVTDRKRSAVIAFCQRANAADTLALSVSIQNGPGEDESSFMISSDALSSILERLQRIEERTALSLTTTSQSCSPAASLGLPDPARSKTSSTSPEAQLQSLDNPTVTPSSDVTAFLNNALDQVQKLRHQSSSVDTIHAVVDIPVDLAKSWVRRYFDMMPTDTFLSFMNRTVLELIPDMIGLPHVHLDAAILVVYYCVLYHGCSLPVRKPNNTADFPDIRYSRKLYLCSLRALPGWQREATGTKTDFIAALFMTRAASECFDFDLSGKMFSLACDYAKGLNLHNFDDESCITSFDKANLDADRKGSWELIHMDLFYRLIYNRPPTISDMSSWRVNLPWLGTECLPDTAEIPTIKFLLSLRVTFALIGFFQLLEEAKLNNEPDLFEKVEAKCREIDDLYSEWKVDKWMEKAKDKQTDAWMLAEVTLTGYTCIIFMIRKTAILDANSPRPISSDHDIPRSSVALSASRRIVAIAHQLLLQCPHPETMALLFGTYRVNVAYTYLICHLLQVQDPDVIANDFQLLERIAESIVALSRQERECTDCIYPERQVRQVNKRIGGHGVTDDTLNVILRRLERIERGTGSPSTTSPQSGTPASLETTHVQYGPQRSRLSPFAISRDQSAIAASDASHDGLSTTGNELVTSPRLPERGPHAVLEEALRRVQDLNHQALSVETVTATIEVPSELAKTWIRRYFELMSTDIFLSLVDRRVIELMPDMIGLPHIRLDPAILVVYYYILRIGCAMPVIDQDQNVHFPGIHYTRSMYICCLRAIPNWQREAAGSTTDLIAAIMMTQAASDALDPRLSAQMFQLVCKYAIGLDLHNTDSPNYPSRFGRDNVDEARRGFWELMHYEFFHRLVYDDPPTMTAQMKEWIVSLPWLEPCKRTVSQEVPTIKFILKSRLTFILAEFFMLLENVQGHLEHESFAKVLALCQQIDDLYKDWDIDTWKASSIENKIHSWMLTDLTLAGYACMLFMLHKASLTTAESPPQISQLPMALNASRQVIKAGNELLKLS